MNLEQLKQQALKLLQNKIKKETAKGNITQAHNQSHLVNTANLSQLIGKIYKLSDQELYLSFFASLFHDIVRSPGEDTNLDDEHFSALEAVKISKQLKVTDEEEKAIYFAINNHGNHPNWRPKLLKQRVHLALFVADKLEQNGVRVIARRSSFVGGERLSKAGDLKDFSFEPNKDELLVVALECVLRLTFINPEYIYPAKLAPLTSPLYQVNRTFSLGLFKNLHLTVKKLAQILINTKRSDNKNLLEYRGIKVKSEKVLIKKIIKKGEITDQKIRSTSLDLSAAAKEATFYFSRNYQKNLEELMLKWRPKNKIAKNWQIQMVEYLDGTWFNSIVKTI